MGGGGAFRDHEDSWLLGFHMFEEGGNSFVAEVTTLRDGLVLAMSRGWNNII